MTPSSCFSSTRNYNTTLTPEAFLLHNPHLCLPKRRSLFSNEALFFKRDNLPLKPNFTSLPNLNLSLRSTRLRHPFASISSFAEAGGEGDQTGLEKHHHGHGHGGVETGESDELPGMARAFNISSNTAGAIIICIAFAALSLPFFMKSLGQGMDLKTKLLSYATLLSGFYMAWNIGANDVANAMGTSVGSGALTLRQAVLMAAVLEFSGALLMGTHVTSTMQKGILVANVFQGNNTLLFAGLLSSLAAAGTWLQVLPLSSLSSNVEPNLLSFGSDVARLFEEFD